LEIMEYILVLVFHIILLDFKKIYIYKKTIIL